jgi:CelD/BcsL family acetyltransferase involved in cellulose biosynthesis
VANVHSSFEFLEHCLESATHHESPRLQIRVVESLASLGDLVEWWDSHAASPMQSPDWLLSWWETFAGPTRQLQILVVQLEQKTLGIAPLYSSRYAGSVGITRWLGSGRACTDFQSLVTAPANQELVQLAVAQWFLNRQRAGTWSMLELDGVGEHALLGVLIQQMQLAGCPVETVSRESTWRIELTDGWKGFVAGLSKTQRAQARNLLNRFDKNQDYRFRIARGDELPAALEASIELHQRRWQATGHPGCFADKRFQKFARRAFERLAASGRAEILLLEDQRRAISALICLCDQHGNRFVYQAGRDPAYESARAGQMLNLLAAREACERGIRFTDYLRGDEIYKPRLGAVPTPSTRYRIFAPTTLSRVAYHALQCYRHGQQKLLDMVYAGTKKSSSPHFEK